MSVRSLVLLTERDFRVRVVFGDEDKMKLKEFVETFGDVKVKFSSYDEEDDIFTFTGQTADGSNVLVDVIIEDIHDSLHNQISTTSSAVSIKKLDKQYEIWYISVFDSEWKMKNYYQQNQS